MKYTLKKISLIEAALEAGSQKIIKNSNLVNELADSIRDDVRSNPLSFPPGSLKNFEKAPNKDLAMWFLENIDNIAREGYEGTVYNREGIKDDLTSWIVRRYIAGSHSWEDLTGIMNMNLRDWYLLKTRELLEPNHQKLSNFRGVRDLGAYINTHYKHHLEKIRDKERNKERNKKAKSVRLVDNDDYRIYTTLNRAAGCALGLGTTWCTANSNYDGHFHRYSNIAMLFQMYPYKKIKDANGDISTETNEDGKNIIDDEIKYQFDAGLPPQFKNILDHQAPAEVISSTYPYLYTDLTTALRQKKDEMEQTFKELSADPTLQADDFKIKTYKIDDEIKKLHKFVNLGYFTDKVRPKSKSDQETHAEQPEVPQQVTQLPPQGEPQMEKVDKDVAAMLRSLKKYDQLVESVAPVLGMKTLSGNKVNEFYSYDKTGPSRDQLAMREPGDVVRDKEGYRDVVNNQTRSARFNGDVTTEPGNPYSLTGPKGYLPEDDMDIGESSFFYPDTRSSRNRVPQDQLAMREPGAVVGDKQGYRDVVNNQTRRARFNGDVTTEPGNAYSLTGPKGYLPEDDMEEGNEFSGALAAANRNHEKSFTVGGNRYPVKEQADQDVLAWMNRFAKLGNMKGYGR